MNDSGKVQKLLKEISNLIDSKKGEAIRFRHNNNEARAIFIEGEASGLELVYRKLSRLLEE